MTSLSFSLPKRGMEVASNFALDQFFEDIHITGAEIKKDGVVIYVSNHWFHLQDPQLVAHVTGRRDIISLAKSTFFDKVPPKPKHKLGWIPWLFKRWIGYPLRRWFLGKLDMYPVNREIDGRGSAAEMKANIRTFKDVASRAAKEQMAIFISPEGGCPQERMLREALPGPALLAFNCLEELPDGGEVYIQPIGLNFSDMNDPLKSRVSALIGEPIKVNDEYGEIYNRDKRGQREARESLRERIDAELRSLVVEVKLAHERLVERIAHLFERGNCDYPELDEVTATGHSLFREVSKRLAGRLDTGDLSESNVVEELDSYLADTERYKIYPGAEREKMKLSNVLLTPFTYLGFALHYVPYKIACLVADKRNKDSAHSDRGYNIMVAGVKTFAVWYGGLALAALVSIIFGPAFFSWLSPLLLLGSFGLGVLASKTLRNVNATVFRWLPGFKKMLNKGKALRARLLEQADTPVTA